MESRHPNVFICPNESPFKIEDPEAALNVKILTDKEKELEIIDRNRHRKRRRFRGRKRGRRRRKGRRNSRRMKGRNKNEMSNETQKDLKDKKKFYVLFLKN